MKLTSAQEAAFNAAGEAMSDLHSEVEFTFHLGFSRYNSDEAKSFQAFTSDTKNRDTVWGHGATAAEAVADLARKVEEANNAPPKLKTAAEAVEAIKGIILESSVDGRAIVEAIDALPVE